MRRLALALGLGLCLVLAAGAAQARCTAGDGDWIARACFTAPYDPPVYGHGVLGATPEWGGLEITLGPRGRAGLGTGALSVEIPGGRVIEDIAPRVAQVTGEGPPEVIFVESAFDRGARLAVFDPARRQILATPFIGTRHRWLAPLGAADLDGDGKIELAYVDRPHLARTLRVWRLAGDGLTEVASLPGVTNHRIGEEFISGGIRDCGAGPEMLVADPGWQEIRTVRLSDGTLSARALEARPTPEGFATALACAD